MQKVTNFAAATAHLALVGCACALFVAIALDMWWRTDCALTTVAGLIFSATPVTFVAFGAFVRAPSRARRYIVGGLFILYLLVVLAVYINAATWTYGCMLMQITVLVAAALDLMLAYLVYQRAPTHGAAATLDREMTVESGDDTL
jgi:hypothetical protein